MFSKSLRNLFLTTALLSSISICTAKNKQLFFNPVFMDGDDARTFLTTGDKYLDNYGDFDIQSRLQSKNVVSHDSVLSFVSKQICGWNDHYVKSANHFVDAINKSIKDNSFVLPMPDQIPFILTTMKEEGGALAYTRKNGIALSVYAFGRRNDLDEVLCHELFHVLSRNNPDFKKKMYKLIGFKILKKDLAVPLSFKNRMISNPDVDHHNSYSTFKIGGKKVDCAMFIYSDYDWHGGSFFSYMKVGLVEINKRKCTLRLKDGNPVIHDVAEAEDFYDKFNSVTGYVIDPEEILADAFSYVLMGYSSSSPLLKNIHKLITK